jgi:glycosyltransferase involved in cell wall biosynthesis
LLDIFEDICKSSDDYRLVLIGIDENEQFFKTYIKEKKMEGKIIVLPPQEDVGKYYQMMDIFVFPSINEGLGMVLIEAQVSGLRCLVSEAIPPEAFVTSRIESMNLSEGVSRWADRIQSYQDLYDRSDHDVEIESYGYSAKKAAKELENIYKGSLEKR